jgi:hypothetical protein
MPLIALALIDVQRKMKAFIHFMLLFIAPQLAPGSCGDLFIARMSGYHENLASDTSGVELDSTYSRRYLVWYTPCKVEEINGIALSFGLVTENNKNSAINLRDSLLIRGLNVQVNPLSALLIPYFLLNPILDGEHPDSSSYYEQHRHQWRTKIHGINLGVNTLESVRIAGLNFTGAITRVEEVHGISVSGISNFAYVMNGLSVSAIRNRATRANGLQIGLYNRAASLRGIQIGLWNVNAKRRLPFLNWQFRG